MPSSDINAKLGKLSHPLSGKEMEERYSFILAPYATETGNRCEEEESPEADNRTVFQRDRDRIIHSEAFRRLMYKTQVFANHAGDHFRTRLTHTLEVAQISRGVCKSLALNEDLAEAIALGHDLGHTPFGHEVERFFDEKFREDIDEAEKTKKKADFNSYGCKYKEFCHNEQSIRVVDELEQRTDGKTGLNLSKEVKEGILKHTEDRSGQYPELKPNLVCSHLEGQIVNIVDTIAYICHDFEDAIKAGIIYKSHKTNPIFQEEFDHVKKILEETVNKNLDESKKIEITFEPHTTTFFIRSLIHHLVRDLTENTYRNIVKKNITSLGDVAKIGEMIASLSPETSAFFEELRDFAYKNIYKSQTISIMDTKARAVVGDIYEMFMEKPVQMPPKWYYKVKCISEENTIEKKRIICDYISCMTDRYALETHDRLFNPKAKL
ncbi:MAG: dNTP triphosphohydrolase [Oscillospiraceae bacterium]|nr:dNTP triphosphohydrolase [Oscillospiraceae bacterium]